MKTAEGNNTGEGSGADDRTEERLRKQVRKGQNREKTEKNPNNKKEIMTVLR